MESITRNALAVLIFLLTKTVAVGSININSLTFALNP